MGLLSGFAHCILMKNKRNRFQNMEIAKIILNSEDLVKTYLQTMDSKDNLIPIEILNAPCNVYASNGEIVACFDILHCLLEQKLPSQWSIDCVVPLPNAFTFNTCIKALVHCKELHKNQREKQNVWRLADFVLSTMEKHKIKKDCSTYSSLFNLCGNSMNEQVKPDLDKAIDFYLQLANSSRIISKKCMYSLLMTGLQFYDYSDSECERTKHDFIEWWLAEAKDYRIQCTMSMQQLIDIKAKKFRIPR